MPSKLIYFPQTTSTMDEARQVAGQGVAGFTAIWAGVQRAGRGRLGRHWQASSQNLMATLILRPENLHPNISHLPYIVVLALKDVVLSLLPGCPVQIKWPNDVLVNGQKLAGILIENDPVSRSSLVGIGLNIGETPRVEETTFPPTSLKSLSQGKVFQVRDVLAVIVQTLEQRCAYWQTHGFDAQLLEEYHGVLWKFNETIEVAFDREKLQKVQGINRGLAPEGCLLLERPGGDLQKLYTGDVG